MYLIVGLGNPGREYAGSRHNLGFRVVGALTHRLRSAKPATKGWSVVTVAIFNTNKVMLAQPLTYMNRSGRAVAELMRNNQISLEEMLVIHDDLDLPPGVIRLSSGGGSAGHRGIQSIIETIGTPAFSRLRIGVGKPDQGTDVVDYVLEPIGQAESELIDVAVEKSVEAVLVFLREGMTAAMNRFNRVLPAAD
ncbi:MAG TPA: aminoacyl-tRNA hydrolase [Candidatus Limnocylindrales bacterium]|nr:aminoacyl-tRNA hydrolase [Candidatus Limnocylindrales bacterium]